MPVLNIRSHDRSKADRRITITESDTVASVKEKIREEHGIIRKIKIHFPGAELPNGATVMKHFPKGATVNYDIIDDLSDDEQTKQEGPVNRGKSTFEIGENEVDEEADQINGIRVIESSSPMDAKCASSVSNKSNGILFI
ncbi:hypothetical protein DL769_001095 [Monosporascus sp. CRB-8-3]|nr:hypothetical protein DL769_001095 [Monosporascus sp. CRB-8-3]